MKTTVVTTTTPTMTPPAVTNGKPGAPSLARKIISVCAPLDASHRGLRSLPMRTLLTCLLLALSLPATSQIYSYTDANGNTVYTNQPPEGIDAKTIDLPPTNSVAAQPVSTPSTTPDSPVTGNAYRVLQLTDIPD